jgi:tetratricopeptide (TPR) repeat protein
MTAGKKKKRSPKPTPDVKSAVPDVVTGRDTGLLLGSLMMVYALVCVASFLPGLQLWGVNHLAFYPLPLRVLVLALIGLTFFPAVAQKAYAGAYKLAHTIKHGGRAVDSALTFVAVGSVAVFAGLRTSTNLLGDGQLIAQSFEAAWKGNEIVIMRSVGAIVTEERIAPGATLLYYGMAKLITGLLDKGPVWGIRYTNCVLGAFFVYIMANLLRRGPFSTEIRLWMLALVFFSSTMQLFFGYVENYTPLVFAGFLYLISALMVLHDRTRLWVPIVLFVVSFYIHIQAVLFFPSLVYLLLWRLAHRRRLAVERYAGPALTAGVVLVAIAAGFTGFGQFYLPLRGDELSYGLFSAVHLLDVLNEILILMPILPFLAVMAWIGRRRESGGQPQAKGRKKAAGATGWFAKRAEWQFAIVLLIPCFVYLFLFKPEIGMARDWDLFTMISLGLVPLALLIVNRFFRSAASTERAGAICSPAIVMTVVLGVAWIGINASSARSTARFEQILEYDKTHASYAYENLAIFYYDNGQLEKATEVMETACDISRNPRQYVRLAMYYDELGRLDEALDLMRSTVAKHPAYEKSRIYYVSQLEKRRLIDELLEASLAGTQHHPNNPMFWFYVGETSLLKGNIEAGVSAHRRCLELNPPPDARRRSQEQIRKYSE